MFPTLSELPKAVVSSAAYGILYGYVFKADLKLAAGAFAVKTFVLTALFAIANPLCKGDAGLKSLKIYTWTYLIGMTASIIAYRQLGLIATFGTVVFSVLTCRNVVKLISIIQALEDQKQA